MDKTEITKLPEGMSSEELDSFTTDEDAEQTDETLAQEALDATATTEEESSDTPAEESAADDTATYETKAEGAEEKPSDEKKPDVDPKDAVIGDFRRKLRESELETARLQGEIEARKSIATKSEAPEKSPLEIAEAAWLADPENENSLEGFAMTGELYRQQRAFDKAADDKVADGKQADTAKTGMDRSINSLQAGDLSVKQAGVGLDFKTVVGLGQSYLDKADLLKIEIISKRDGVDAAVRKAYELCKAAVLAAGNEDSELLRNAINIKGKGKSKSQPKSKKKATDIDALTTEGEDTVKGEAETETHSKRLTEFIFEPD